MGKIGRNDTCPCGSGKKYKKCCLNGPRKIPQDDPDYTEAHGNLAYAYCCIALYSEKYRLFCVTICQR